MQTALELLDNNYNVIVLADGVSSMNPGEVKIAIAVHLSVAYTYLLWS